MNFKIIQIVGLFVLIPFFSYAQEISNIHFEQVGKQIHIYYDLEGEQEYAVQVFCSEDGGKTWGNELQKVTGAVGENQVAGNNKKIMWDVLNEREKLSGNVSFKLEASRGPNIEMVFVKGGSFNMGSNNGGKDEKPIHSVTVNDFYIGKYEITQKQWREVMGNNPSKNIGCDECPVERVSWNEVQEFIRKLNEKTGNSYRLLTEAEWEFAAGGGNNSNSYTYSGSNNSDDVAWCNRNSGNETYEVGVKAANELGIHDMSGNVWEWCNDWYNSSFYSNSPQIYPKGPSGGLYRVFRGGSWVSDVYNCRVTDRCNGIPDFTDSSLGFRLAK